ncbi:hypothetical protein GUJ93_ZPchr0006g43342 [Zizania palustris]|uniref:Uncharacterized protein n=1 Tax=Zizania palustris TaxID=103762 RepID=A0A8J5VT48_ZIZPA|nr:hypothetical protein GUJ93_ZPchr0006g43342 [Zizania palustris]
MEARRRRSASTAEAARRRLNSLLALACDYVKYLFMKRRRLLGKVARRTLALILSSSSSSSSSNQPGRRRSSSSKHHLVTPSSATAAWPPRALLEHEFSCSNSPSPAFLAARRLRSRLMRGGAAASSSCFGALRVPCGSPAAVEDEEDDEADVGWVRGMELLENDVDYRAEEFINMFYEQLRAQSFTAAFHHCRYSP